MNLYDKFKSLYTAENPMTVLETLECVLKTLKQVDIVTDTKRYRHNIVWDFEITDTTPSANVYKGSLSMMYISNINQTLSRGDILTIAYLLYQQGGYLPITGAFLNADSTFIVTGIQKPNLVTMSDVALHIAGVNGAYTASFLINDNGIYKDVVEEIN